jgi:hypothetical protein
MQLIRQLLSLKEYSIANTNTGATSTTSTTTKE